jgi:predicted nucleic acid-binding protein
LRQGTLSLTDAFEFMRTAESLFRGAEYQVDSAQILALVNSSRCSAYDCEFVALARELGVSLLTTDKQILKDFPDTAVPLERLQSP